MARPARNDIELGLTALCEHAAPDQTMKLKDIADVCGCSPRLIRYIEKTAMEKLKAALWKYEGEINC